MHDMKHIKAVTQYKRLSLNIYVKAFNTFARAEFDCHFLDYVDCIKLQSFS